MASEMQRMRIGVAGLSGRVGSLLADEIVRHGARFVGGISGSGRSGPGMAPDIETLAEAADVVIDFSVAAAAPRHAAALERARVGWVLGTTGLDGAAQARVARAAEAIAIVQAANFSIGATVLVALARRLASVLDGETYDADILETHHRGKRDAPSGTALAIGHAVAGGRGTTLDAVRLAPPAATRDPSEAERRRGGIGFAALRAGAVVGEHSVSFTSAREQVSLSHRAFDRAVFAEGAVRAASWLQDRPPGLYGMQDVLGLALPT